MANVPELHRVTTRYIEAEDRLRLAAHTQDGSRVVLWLTRRLADRLIPHLWRWVAAQPAVADRPGAAAIVSVAPIVQSFAQEAARAAKPQLEAVEPAQPQQEWLVCGIDVSIDARTVRLTFKDEDSASAARRAALGLGCDAARQWLGILSVQYRRASWPTTGWPTWLLEAKAGKSEPEPLH